MPSLQELRELLASSIVSGDTHDFFMAIIKQLEALVKPVEPEETCAGCEFYIKFLCRSAPGYVGGWKFTKPDTTACKRFAVSTVEPEDTELAEAKATIERLHDERDERALLAVGSSVMREGRTESLERVCAQLIEAKAKIEKLRESRDDVYAALVATEKELASYTASVNADAALGRLVRGMQARSRLLRGSGDYGIPCYGIQSLAMGEVSWGYDDPAEALRSIQKVADAEVR